MTSRTHIDRCPGVLRPWVADDGAIVRLRLVGGTLPASMLMPLMEIAATYADGTVLLTKRANLQLRGIGHDGGSVPADLVDALTGAGFLPFPSHELVRNIMMSPLTGRAGGRADLRGLATEIDRQLCAAPQLAHLAGRFLFVLDDGRGDLAHRSLDLGVTALDSEMVQLRIGSHHWGPRVRIDAAAGMLIAYARKFLNLAGSGDHAPWHIDELPGGGSELISKPSGRDERTHVTSPAPPPGTIVQDHHRHAVHLDIPDGVLTHDVAQAAAQRAVHDIIVTPWRSIILPDLENP